MTVTERLMKPGQFTLRLLPETPLSVWNAVREFDHIMVTPARLDPISGFSDANIKTAAMWTGVALRKPSATQIEGAGLAWWLGSDDGVGDLLDTAVTGTTANLTTWVNALRPSSLSAGTVTNTGTNLTYSFQWITRREALDFACRAMGAEWRVNPSGTLDAAAPSTLFVSTPTAVITRRPDAKQGTRRGLEATELTVGRDVAGYTTKVIAVARTGDTALAPTGTATGANVYKDYNNNDVVLERLVDATDTPAGSVADVATATLALWSSVRRSVKLSSRTYAVPMHARPGDSVWAYDPTVGLIDTANQLEWSGETIAPVLLRVRAITWPIAKGMGVYARRSGSTPTYIDLTDWVEWENGDTVWDVGASAWDVDQDSSQLSPAYLGSNPAIEARTSAVGQRAVKFITSNVTNNNATPNTIADVTGLSFPVVNGKRYGFRFQIVYTAAATGTGSRWSINGPTANVHYRSEYSLTKTSRTYNEGLTTYDAPAAANATSATTGSNIAVIEGTIAPTADGTVIARFASEVGSSAVVALANVSYVEWWEYP